MARARHSFLPLAAAVVFIALEIASAALLRQSSTLQDIWLNRLSHSVINTFWSGSEAVRGHFSLREQNDALRAENFRLEEELRTLRLAEQSRRESASGLKDSTGRFVCIPATVTKMSRNTAHNYIILNKGSEDGVTPHCGIVTQKGVVGIISAVDRHHSYGLTLMNAKISVSSRIGRTGLVARLVWDGRHSDKAFLTDLPLHYTIAEQDTVVTSGYSSIFPPDIPIGVTGLSNIVDGATMKTDVTLFQDFSSLRYVTIVCNPEREEISRLEGPEEEAAQ